jgi:hypothetical protein
LRFGNEGGARYRVLTTRAIPGFNHPSQPEHALVLRLLNPCDKVVIVLSQQSPIASQGEWRPTRCCTGRKRLPARKQR